METFGEQTPKQEFFTSIEEHFGRLRKRPLILAPLDVALVNQWFDAGVPLVVVLKALDRFFARDAHRETPRRRPPTLGYCEADVFEVWEIWKETRIGDDSDFESAEDREREIVLQQIHAIRVRLERGATRASERGERRLAKALEGVVSTLTHLADSVDEITIEEIETSTLEAEKKLLRAARRELDEAELERLEQLALQHVGGIGKGIDERAYKVLRRKAEERTILAHFELPRVALFSF